MTKQAFGERGLGARAAARRIFVEIEAEWGERVGAEEITAVRRALERLAAGG